MEQIAGKINTLSDFCGKRDVDELSCKCLFQRYHIEQADVMVLFGGSILAGGDVLAKAIQDNVAKKYIIVGGAGHTTDTLRKIVHTELPHIDTAELSEAEVFDKYIKTIYGCQADRLETSSTNCGNNITYLLDLLRIHDIPYDNIILCQDATMQIRMDAGMRKYAPEKNIINYAAYHAKVVIQEGKLEFVENIHGMWNMERFINLLMGEIPRLRDDIEGYGPKGKHFIAHVDIPDEVMSSYELLKNKFGIRTREANPLYASK